MRHVVASSSLLALCLLVPPAAALAQPAAAAERPADQVLLQLAATHGVGLVLSDDAKAILASRRLVFEPSSKLSALTTIEALLRTIGVDFERIPESSLRPIAIGPRLVMAARGPGSGPEEVRRTPLQSLEWTERLIVASRSRS